MLILYKSITSKIWLAVAFLLALVFFIQCFAGARRLSLTWDEPSFISAGYIYLTRNDFRLNPSHPPLMQEIEAMPLLFLDLKVPDYPAHWLSTINPVRSYGQALIFQSGNDPLRIAFLARLPVMVIGALLVLAIFLWGRSMFGPGPAVAAAALASFCPNLLAHAKLATEDLGCSAFIFFAAWSFWHASRKPLNRNWAICGLITGLALLSKYTALILGPIYLLFSVWLILNKDSGLKTSAMLRGLAITGSISIIVVGAGYNFTFDWETYLLGISKIYQDLVPKGSYYNYMLGKVSAEPWWYFNLVGLATKMPLPMIILIGLAAATCVKDRIKSDKFIFLLVPAVLIIVTSFFDRENFGIRRILPAFPFLLLFTALASAGKAGSLKKIVVGVLIVWAAAESALIFPFHLSYFNVLAGGPERGPYIFQDSNVDWGQDLPSLAKWQKSHPDATPLKLFYFGTASPQAYGVDALPMPEEDIMNPKPGSVYAISAHNLVYLRKNKILTGVDSDWLAKYTPSDRAGYSIYIYRF